MEFEAGDQDHKDEQRETTLRRVAYAITAITSMAALLILPTAVAWSLGPLLSPSSGLWLIGGTSIAAIWLTPLVMFPAATRVLLGRAESLYPGGTWMQSISSILWMLLCLPLIFGLGPRLRAWGGSLADLPLYALFVLPGVLPPLWRRWSSGRAIWPAALPYVLMFGAMIGVGGLTLAVVVQLPSQWFFWSLGIEMLLLVMLLPIGVMGAFAIGHLSNVRRVLLPAAAGDFVTAAALARDVPDMGDELAAALRMENGDFEGARELIAGLDEPTPMTEHLEAVFEDEEGDPEAAWKRMAASWEEHKQPLEVMIAAQGLAVGADVLDLLDEMDSHRSEVDRWLLRTLGLDPDPGFAACRAWALAAQGREEHARTALPTITDLPPVLATERDYLYGRALHALGDPEWRGFVERAADGVGRAARLAQRFLEQALADET